MINLNYHSNGIEIQANIYFMVRDIIYIIIESYQNNSEIINNLIEKRKIISKVLPFIFWMNCYSSISKHGFNTSSCYYYFFIRSFHSISKRYNYSKFNFICITRYRKKCSTRNFDFIYLNNKVK